MASIPSREKNVERTVIPGAAVVLREFHRDSREREAVVWLAIFVNVGVAQLE